MGLFSKKTKTSSTTNQNTTMNTTPVNPTFVTSGLEGAGNRISNYFSGLDPKSLVADADPLQTQAAGSAAGLGGESGKMFDQGADLIRAAGAGGANTYNPAFMEASGYTPQTGTATTGQASSLLENLGSYMNPFDKMVRGAALNEFDYDAGRQRAQADLNIQKASPFGGSGAALEKSFLGQDLTRGRSSLDAGLLKSSFDTGAQLSGQDADRRQGMTLANMGAQNQYGLANMDAMNGAGQFNASARNAASANNQNASNTAGQFNANANESALNRWLSSGSALTAAGTARDANTRSNIGAQSDMGGIMRAIQNDKNLAPLQALLAESGLWGNLPLDVLKGSTSTGTMDGTSNSTTKESGATMSDWAKIAAAAAMASDGRLKRDIETVGYDQKGRRWVDFAYHWDEPGKRHRGVIAQEVRKTDPDAVLESAEGVLFVDYSKLGDA